MVDENNEQQELMVKMQMFDQQAKQMQQQLQPTLKKIWKKIKLVLSKKSTFNKPTKYNKKQLHNQ